MVTSVLLTSKNIYKDQNTWRLGNRLLNNQWISEEIKEDINKRKSLERNENESTMTQNLWNTAKTVLREKFIARNVYLRKQVNLKQPNLTPKAIRERMTTTTKCKVSRKKL